ncbi:hypothetical protein STENM36S_07338 [Streptomyces tendae]
MSRPSGRTPDAALIAIRSPFRGVFPGPSGSHWSPGLAVPPGPPRGATRPRPRPPCRPRVRASAGRPSPGRCGAPRGRAVRRPCAAARPRPAVRDRVRGHPRRRTGRRRGAGPAVLVLGLLIGRGVGLARCAALVAHRYADQVVGVRSSHTMCLLAVCTITLVTSSETTRAAVSQVSSHTAQPLSRARVRRLASRESPDERPARNGTGARRRRLPTSRLPWRHRGPGSPRWRLFLRARTESRLPLSPRREHLASVTLKIAECCVTFWTAVAHCSQQHVERRHFRS